MVHTFGMTFGEAFFFSLLPPFMLLFPFLFPVLVEFMAFGFVLYIALCGVRYVRDSGRYVTAGCLCVAWFFCLYTVLRYNCEVTIPWLTQERMALFDPYAAFHDHRHQSYQRRQHPSVTRSWRVGDTDEIERVGQFAYCKLDTQTQINSITFH